MKLKPIYLILSIVLFTVSCKRDSDSESGIQDHLAYLGGKVINPNSDYIVLRKSTKLIDTIFLNKKNKFLYKLEDFEPGLYNFFDGKEAQSVLIHDKDSLMLRLNTIEFDESLVYTGIGAKENNYLMDLFLVNEIEERTTLGSCKALDPVAFDKKYRTIRDSKLRKLKAFEIKNKTSDLFHKIATANINYLYYSHKELYPLAHDSQSDKDIFNLLPDNFYDYRKNVDYNNDILKDFGIYYNFLRSHFNNIALQKHFEHSDDKVYDELLVDYNLDKINLIDEKIKNESIKNILLNSTMMHFISVSNKTEDYDEMLQSFKAKSTNNNDISRATRIVESYKRLKPGQDMPEIKLLDEKDNPIYLNDLFKKPTVLYFWTKNNTYSIINSHKRVKELNAKYPEVDFISINLDSISYEEQASILKRYGIKNKNEYRFLAPEQSKEILSVKPINKVFLIDSSGKIINAKANMFNIRFEQELLGTINKI
jgi:peroxiredoxin